MKNARAILRFLHQAAARGERTALVTITAVEGRSPRAPGTHMAVSETGAFRGALSGGCVEAGIVAEARRIIATGRAEMLRIGAGSQLIDLVLPCGGAMELLVSPDPAAASIAAAEAMLAARRAAALVLGADGAVGLREAAADEASAWQGAAFVAVHRPDLRLLIAGQGAEALAMARLAGAYGAEVAVLSPEASVLAEAAALGAETLRLPARHKLPPIVGDARTGFVCLFHDHAWEVSLLQAALYTDCFYVGAMGSQATQRNRLRGLQAAGLAPDTLVRLAGPIGLLPAARDPDTLALSALAEIVQRFRALHGE